MAKMFGSALLQPAHSVCVSLSAFFITACTSRLSLKTPKYSQYFSIQKEPAYMVPARTLQPTPPGRQLYLDLLTSLSQITTMQVLMTTISTGARYQSLTQTRQPASHDRLIKTLRLPLLPARTQHINAATSNTMSVNARPATQPARPSQVFTS